jgi:hypothetical protein
LKIEAGIAFEERCGDTVVKKARAVALQTMRAS